LNEFPVALGAIEPGQEVNIAFRVQIARSIPSDVQLLSIQGRVEAANIETTLTKSSPEDESSSPTFIELSQPQETNSSLFLPLVLR
jgi:hypothetical protein